MREIRTSGSTRGEWVVPQKRRPLSCSTGEDTPSITQDLAFIFIPFCGEREAKAD